jgi:hypothetical protein
VHAKVFTASSGPRLEEALTRWLDANPRVAVVAAAQSSDRVRPPGASESVLRITLTVLYSGPRASEPPPPGVQHRE